MLLWMETLSTDGKCREHDSGLDLVGASHLSLISHPNEITNLILNAAGHSG